jgi:hypothetical protein
MMWVDTPIEKILQNKYQNNLSIIQSEYDREMESFESMKNMGFNWEHHAQQTLLLKKASSAVEVQLSQEEISWEFKDPS